MDPSNQMAGGNPAVRTAARSKLIIVSLTLLASIVAWRAIEIHHPLGVDYSPDGLLRADYSYRSRDIVGWLLSAQANPILFLEVRDVKTDRLVFREQYMGDLATLSEARERFADRLPWNSVH